MIDKIFITKEAYTYLEKHQMLELFMKAIIKLKSGQNAGVDLKKRKPKVLNIWSFRITKKYRAWCRRRGSELTVYKIDAHR
ncbi:hypothetical protein KJ652_05705 [Patescibacteria group bacterium]|nr:hypothetical protein [Patescibacteria group bacterium]MBU1124056.1 hypothetical protein [Patescibacteria group bacterium]